MKKLKLTPWQPKEYDESVVIFEWARLMETQRPELKLMFATLNGVRLPIGLAVKAKRAGMRTGCPDIYLDVPRDGYHGLRLELKRRQGGRLSEAQKWFIEQLRLHGYRVEVPAGATEAIAIISEYLGVK